MTRALESRVAVITGAASGIGAAIASALRAAGAVVIGLDLNSPAESQREVFDQFVEGDVTAASSWSAVDEAVRGHRRWDILVNNAALQIEQSILDTEPEAFARVLEVNVIGPFRGIKAAAGMMKRGASIVNIGSIMGFTADPLLGGYPASKAAVINLTRTAALALGRRGVRVNAVCPGSVLTPLTTRILDLTDDPVAALQTLKQLSPMNELCTVEEVAAIVTFLASDASTGMNGSVLVADKGLTAANAEWALSAEIVDRQPAEEQGGSATK